MVFLSNPEISFFEPVSEDLGEIFEQWEPGWQIGGQGRQCDMDEEESVYLQAWRDTEKDGLWGGVEWYPLIFF